MRKFVTKWSPTGDRYAVPADDVTQHEWAAEDDGPDYYLVPGVGFVPPLAVARDGDNDGTRTTWQGHGAPYGDLTTVDN